MLMHLRSASGRRVAVDIKENLIEDIEIADGSLMRASNNPTNTSQNYKSNVTGMLRGMAHHGDMDRVKVAFMTHTPTGGATIDPAYDTSANLVHLVKVPSLYDPQRLSEIWNEAAKTQVTETVVKSQITSGYIELKINGASVSTKFRTLHYLASQAAKEKADQLALIPELLRT